MTNPELCEKYGVSNTLISRWKIELGLVKGVLFNKINKNDFVADCKAMSYRELEEKYNVTQSCLQRWKKKLGIYVAPRNKTHEQFLEEVKAKYGNEYLVVGKYLGSQQRIKIKHNICGKDFTVRPPEFLTIQTCPYCTSKMKFEKQTKSPQEFREKVFAIVGDEYSIVEDYQKSNIQVKMRHNVCGNEYLVMPHAFLLGNRCPKCALRKVADKTRKPHDVFESEIYDIYGDTFKIIDKYINRDTKIRIKHNKCGKTCKVAPRTLYHGYRCQYCQSDNVSFGETQIQEYLESHHLSYQRNYRIPECKNKVSLPFDFAVFETNGKLKMLIEYDGEQHYFPIDFWGGKDGLRYRKQNDQIKTSYCIKNKIPLIRISFKQLYQIEEILSDNLLQQGGVRMV